MRLGAVLLAGVLCGGPAEAGMLLSAAPAGGGAPANTVLPALSMTGSGMSTSSLACSQGTWTGNPTITYAYQFNRDGTAIGGATSTPYTAVTADQGHSITCTVTATNGSGSVPATSGPQAVASCTQSASWFSRVWTLPATVNQTHVAAYDTMICGLVTDTVWATLDALWLPATADATSSSTVSQSIANLNLVSSSFTLVLHGSPTFVLNAGYTGGSDLGSGVTVWIDTGFNPSSGTHQYAIGNAHMMGWMLAPSYHSSGYAALLGAQDASNGTLIIPYATNNDMYMQLNGSASGLPGVAVSTSAGSFVASRFGTSTAQVNTFYNGGLITLSSTPAATAIPTVSHYLLAENLSGAASNGGPNQIAAASFGSSLASTTPPAVSSSGGTTGSGLIPRLCAYLTTVHGSC